MSQTQYDAIIDMSKNDGVNKPFETINQPVHSEQTKDEALKPFILLVVGQHDEGLKAANELLDKTNANPVITTDTLIFLKKCCMVNTYQMKQVHYIIVKDLLHI